MTDYILAGVSSIITALIGILGWHVTMHPPAGKNKEKERRRFTNWFIALTLLSLILINVLGVRSSQQLSRIEENTTLPAAFNLSTPQQVSPLVGGQKLMFNINFHNGGPIATVGEGRVAALSFISPVLTSAQDQAELEKRFNEFWTNPNSQIFHLASTEPGAPGMVSTTQAPILSDEDAKSLQAGTSVIYVLTRMTYSDKYGAHTQDFCQLSQPPQNTTTGPMTLFHVCPFGNLRG
jgi:hypothetical protein